MTEQFGRLTYSQHVDTREITISARSPPPLPIQA